MWGMSFSPLLTAWLVCAREVGDGFVHGERDGAHGGLIPGLPGLPYAERGGERKGLLDVNKYAWMSCFLALFS